MDQKDHILKPQLQSSSEPPSSQSCQDDSDVEEVLDLPKLESESGSKSTGSDANDSSSMSKETIDTASMLQWLGELSKRWNSISAISLSVLPLEKDLRAKIVELLADIISTKDDCIDPVRDIIKKGHDKQQPAYLVRLLNPFTEKKLTNWDAKKFVKGTSRVEKKMLMKSLENAFASQDQREVNSLKDDFQKLQKMISILEAELQENAMKILPNCNEDELNKIKQELSYLYPDSDKWKEELIKSFSLGQASFKTFLNNKSKRKQVVLFDALNSAADSQSPTLKDIKKQSCFKNFRAEYRKRKNSKLRLEMLAKALPTLDSPYFVEKVCDHGKTDSVMKTMISDLVEDIEKSDETEELLTKVADIFQSGTQSEDEDKFFKEWSVYENAHQAAKENAILILSLCDLKLHEDLSKKLKETITSRGKALKKFQDFLADSHYITTDSVEKLLRNEDEKDDFYEVLLATHHQSAPQNQEIEYLLQEAKQHDKKVESSLGEVLLSCKNGFLNKFIEELKKHVIGKAIFDASLTMGALIEATEDQGAEIVEVTDKDLDSMRQLVIIRNEVVHSFFEFTSEKQRVNFSEGMREIVQKIGLKKDAEEILLFSGSQEAAKFIESSIGLVEEDDKNKEEIRKLTAEVALLKSFSKTHAEITEERAEKSKKRIRDDIDELRDMAEKIFKQCDNLSDELEQLTTQQ